jgi:hypothetical protein
MRGLSKFCQLPEQAGTDLRVDVNLRINPTKAQMLLDDPHFRDVDTEDLIALASQKVKGVTDRCTAIAVLKGV